MIKLIALMLSLLLIVEANDCEPHDHKPPKIVKIKDKRN